MGFYSPKAVEDLTGVKRKTLTSWHDYGPMERIGARGENSRRYYGIYDLLIIASARQIKNLGVDIETAIEIAYAAKNDIASYALPDEIRVDDNELPKIYVACWLREEGADPEAFCILGRKKFAYKFAITLEEAMDHSASGVIIIDPERVVKLFPPQLLSEFHTYSRRNQAEYNRRIASLKQEDK